MEQVQFSPQRPRLESVEGSSESVTRVIGQSRLLPVIVIDNASRAEGLGNALVESGLFVAEVTLRTPTAIESLTAMARNPGLVVGAGTVLTAQQAEQAIDAGARFVVSPGLDDGVVRVCQKRGVLVVPGVASPTEVQRASNLGLKLLKFFPAEAIGGVKLLTALAGPFPDVQFIPTGGIGPANLSTYLKHPAVLACGGSWMLNRESVEDGNWPLISAAIRAAVELVAHG